MIAYTYTDDLIISSRSKTGLQNCLNTLSLFCTSWMLKINHKKTKIMVFRNVHGNVQSFAFSQVIKLLMLYKNILTRELVCLLREIFQCRVNISNKEKVLHALFSLRRHTNLSKLEPAIACKIFDTMIFPILTYNSEIWGVYAKPDFKAQDGTQIFKKTHLQFCKRYLEVNNKASNIPCRAELGRFP